MEKFRLDKILKLQKYNKDQWTLELGSVNRDISRLKAENKVILNNKISVDLRNSNKDLHLRDNFYIGMDHKINKNNETISSKKIAEVKIRKELADATMFFDSLDKLKDKKMILNKKKSDKKEQKFLDEISMNQYFRNKF